MKVVRSLAVLKLIRAGTQHQEETFAFLLLNSTYICSSIDETHTNAFKDLVRTSEPPESVESKFASEALSSLGSP